MAVSAHEVTAMKRYEYNLYHWCEQAASRIKFKPDRKKVINELYDHAMERFEDLSSKGLDDDEAEKRTLESMGDAEALSFRLAVIHRPFWGYFMRTCQVLLIVILCLDIIPVWNYFDDLQLQDHPPFLDFDPYEPSSYGDDTGRTLLHLSHPSDSFSTDGSTFKLTDAVIYTSTRSDGTVSAPILCFQIRQSSLLPRTEHDEYFTSNYASITSSFFVKDSLGNTYNGYLGKSTSDVRTLHSYSMQSGLFTASYECWINDFPTQAQWVDICYERDGRSYTMRIDLTGGGVR